MAEEKSNTVTNFIELEDPQIFPRTVVEENLYYCRGCTHAPTLNESSRERHCQMCRCAQMHAEGDNTPSNYPIVEVRFKNTRKGYFRIPDDPAQYSCGDIVAVEGDKGHEIGLVSLQGDAVRIRLNHIGIEENSEKIKKLLRKARQPDIDKWIETIRIERETQRRARIIAAELGLEMKINSVEYQGDRTKAIFYYTADGRVDFRQLIKRYAEEFRVRIEMKQIGMRQEASIIGGIGPCGREFCCVTFKRDFNSVSTDAARPQQLSLNPQKLAGQCGKLKCCLNYEAEVYEEALAALPDSKIPIETEDGTARCVKIDIFKRVFSYVYDNRQNDFIDIAADDVAVYLEMNKNGKKAPNLQKHAQKEKNIAIDVASQDDVKRFDNSEKHIHKTQQRKPKHKRPISMPTISKPVIKSVILLCFAATLFSCKNDTIIDGMYETPAPFWSPRQAIPIEANISDTAALYDVFFSVRNTTDYPYANAFFLVKTTFPSDEKYTDTIECILADATGRWLGGGMGHYRTRVFLMKNRIKFPRAGIYHFDIQHAMRSDTLKEISDVGIKIKRCR
ncbi:MAG: gliding motility lipoprotein GldH [Bacteroidales bacterium]|jgi:gliding motility-associated lipoprotein GldH|nr:gliding motility lipoprotein GldH [Bacteroidales bacterium]